MSPSPAPLLPPRYYLDHFEELLGFVEAKYRHALEAPHRAFLDEFRALPLAARCLYVRITNRRGRVFRRDRLRYPEIEDLEATVRLLGERGFIRAPRRDDFAGLLALDPRPELLARLRNRLPGPASTPPRLSSSRKEELVRTSLALLPFEAAFPAEELDRYLVQDRVDEVSYLLFLYFGGLHRDLTALALRDLGRMRPAPFRTDFEPRFATGEAARACFFYVRLLEELDRASLDEALAACAGIAAWPVVAEPEVVGLRHRALHRLGRLCERLGRPDEALSVFARSDEYPATERTARLLFASGRREECEALLHRMIDDPSCDAELYFAGDFLERKFQRKRTGRLTDLLRAAPVLALDESGRDRPEEAAAARLRREGAEAAHGENALWSQLFGLLFWDLLFGPELSALHDPFDFTPGDLAVGTFLERHREAVGNILARLDDVSATLAALDATWTAQRGLPNSLVPWDETLYALVRRLVATAPRGALAAVLREMARDHRSNRNGFPDLVVFKDGGVRFLEVKTPGDQIRRQQLVQIERLRRAGFDVGVVQLRWIVDPEQDYVVVDIETTGSDPSAHRLTEIGAVRVRGGRVLAEWSTLVNPGRRIPGFIAQLTGITDPMVADAPRFAEVADDFRAFLGDAVFVAHRAKFDHGFLKAEFARLGQDFGGPVLCTLVESRRLFPGLSSYGLAALCGQFGIPLESHHSALCDARATAELLVRIHERRMAAPEH